jgi:hypothetical protein
MANAAKSFTSPIPRPQKIEREIATERTIIVTQKWSRNEKLLKSIVARDVIARIKTVLFGMRCVLTSTNAIHARIGKTTICIQEGY